MADLLDPYVLRDRIEFACAEKNPVLKGVYGKDGFDPQKLYDDYTRYGEVLADRITNGTILINEQIRDGKRVLFEGAQGTLLDIDHGTYPFVTSSSATVGGACTGLGVAADAHRRRHRRASRRTRRASAAGRSRPSCTTPSASACARRGNEFGTTTGRPRRCGWLDPPSPRVRPARSTASTRIALTKLDVLDEFDEIPVCTGYNVRSEVWKTFPAFAVAHHDYKPEYRMFKGWKEPTVGMTSYDDLPQAAKDYVRFIEDEVECQGHQSSRPGRGAKRRS